MLIASYYAMNLRSALLILSSFVIVICFQNCGSQFEGVTQTELLEKQYLAQSQSSPSNDQEEPMVATNNDSDGSLSTLKLLSQKVWQVTDSSVKVSWTTSHYTQGYIEYGLSTSLGFFSENEESFKYNKHNQVLSGLLPGEKYYFKIHAKDEAGHSFVSSIKNFTTLEKSEDLGPIVVSGNNYLFYGGFEGNEGQYASTEFKDYWGIRWSALGNYGRFTTDKDKSYRGQSLLVRYPGVNLVSSLRVSYATDFKKLKVELKEEAYLRYYVKFHPGWEWVISGKFPGLAGHNSITGGDAVNGKNGWSQRWGWYYGEGPSAQRKKGVPIIYSYIYAKGKDIKTSKYGFKFRLYDQQTKKEMVYPVGEWVCLEQRVKLNDVGKPNGIIQAWVNGEMGLNYNDITYRTTENEETMIGQMLFSTFYGGGGNIYAPTKDTYASYDDFVISEKRIGCH